MRKWRFWLAILACLVLVSCAPATPAPGDNGSSLSNTNTTVQTGVVAKSSRFVCFQSGQKIIDTVTINGAQMKRYNWGDWIVVSWVWEDEAGSHSMPYEGTVCQQTY